MKPEPLGLKSLRPLLKLRAINSYEFPHLAFVLSDPLWLTKTQIPPRLSALKNNLQQELRHLRALLQLEQKEDQAKLISKTSVPALKSGVGVA